MRRVWHTKRALDKPFDKLTRRVSASHHDVDCLTGFSARELLEHSAFTRDKEIRKENPGLLN
jgi:hypothetical protein